jgi:succinate dehydrogenase/fumarate reductase flavoprotein subunit
VSADADLMKVRDELQRAMTANAGVLRSAESLRTARAVIDDAERALPVEPTTAGVELGNLCTVARAVVAAAGAREETRGAHSRVEFPESRDPLRVRFVLNSPD